MRMNAFHNVSNPNQGKYKKVLCVCSAGLLRSPTAALVLSQPPFNFNTRAAGANQEYALIPVDGLLLHWADEIVVMNQENITQAIEQSGKPYICLDIPDQFRYRDPELMKMIEERYLDRTMQGE